MKEFSFENLMAVDLSQVTLYVTDIVRNPTSNLTALMLLIGVLTIVVLLVIVGLVWIFTGMTDEDEEEGRVTAVPVASDEYEEPARELTPEEIEARKRRALLGGLVWALVVVAIWVAGGWVSARNSVCISCHLGGTDHATRAHGLEDPHETVSCVACHETPSVLRAWTLAVPGRALHYIGGFTYEPLAVGYGSPVAVNDCSSCHEAVLAATFVNKQRGLRMSHVEPMESGAQCVDCHAPHGDGTVDRYTVGMETCIRCHDAVEASAECSYCHTRDFAYSVRSKSEVTPKVQVHTVDCGGCHDTKTCDACHGSHMPHTQSFMAGGHAREAVEDIWFNAGRACKGCHSESRRPCSRCHKGTFPSHPSPWFAQGHQPNDPSANGCDNCHGYNAWIVGRNFCANCHPEYPIINLP